MDAGTATVRIQGTAMDVSRDGVRPLPDEVLAPLLPRLAYRHVRRLYGPEAVDPVSGQRKDVEVESRVFYRIDARGRLLLPSGFRDLVTSHLRQQGLRVVETDLTPPADDPAALDLDVAAPERAGFAYRAGQEPVVAAVLERILDRRYDGGVVQLPPGAGKSYLFAAIALAVPRARVVITVPDVANARKTVRDLTAYTPHVGQIGGGARDPARITVVTADSLHRIPAGADLLLVDEAHTYATERRTTELARIAIHAVRFGFTATPEGRQDGLDARLEAIFGPVVYRMTHPEAVALGLIVPLRVRWTAVELDDNPAAGLKGVPHTRWAIWRNAARNALVAEAARDVPDDAQSLVLVANVEHALRLHALLPEFTLVHGDVAPSRRAQLARQGVLTPDTPLPDAIARQRLYDQFRAGDLKRVIATDIWGQGVSFDGLYAVVRADARRSPIKAEQFSGRATRRHTGKDHGRLHDFDDRFDPLLANASRARAKHYRSNGWPQENEPGTR